MPSFIITNISRITVMNTINLPASITGVVKQYFKNRNFNVCLRAWLSISNITITPYIATSLIVCCLLYGIRNIIPIAWIKLSLISGSIWSFKIHYLHIKYIWHFFWLFPPPRWSSVPYVAEFDLSSFILENRATFLEWNMHSISNPFDHILSWEVIYNIICDVQIEFAGFG